MLAPVTTAYARAAMVTSPDHVATSAGLAILRRGGSAADAAVAAAAVLAVTWPMHCGPGGDLFALVCVPGEDEPAVLNASGRAGAGADAERLREEGFRDMPRAGDVRSVTVPGCVDGWLALHERYGRLDLADVLEPALRCAEGGFAAPVKLVESDPVATGQPELAAATRPGAVVRRPGLARALSAIVREGRKGFYGGAFGEALLELGGGEFAPADLEAAGSEWVAPLGLRAFGHQLWTVPPNSQGYLTLAGAWVAQGLDLTEPGDARWPHALAEAAKAVARDRDSLLHEEAAGRLLLAPDRREAQRAGIDPMRAAPPIALRGGGGTIGLAAVDADGMGVSLIQSNFSLWGSGLFVDGIALHNRGAAFSAREWDPAEYGPGRRPPHTLSPLVIARPDGSLHSLMVMMGGQAQPQILLQLVARRLKAGQAPGELVAAGRWALERDGLAVEAHAARDWFEGLAARGHRVLRRPSFSDQFGHAQVICVEDDHLAGAADPRALGGSASGF